MKRLLTSTTALSVALAFIPPMPLMAQTVLDDGKVVAVDGTTVLCDPATGVVCDLAALQAQVQAKAAAQAAADAAIAAQADADAAAQAAADAAAEAQAQAETDAASAAKAASETAAAAAAQAQAEADAAAVEQAQADADVAEAQAKADADAADADAKAKTDADAAAQAQVEADAAAEAEADAATEADAAAQTEADAAAATQEEADAATQAEADAAAKKQAEAESDAAALAKTEADAAAAVIAEQEAAQRAAAAIAAGNAEAAAQPQAEAETAAAATAAAEAARVAAQAEADAAALAATGAADAQAAAAAADAAAAAADAPLVVTEEAAPAAPVDAPVPTETAVEGLTAALQEPAVTDGTTERTAPIAEAAAVTAAPLPDGMQPSEVAAPNVSVVVTQSITAADTRSSSEEFTAAPVEVSNGKKSGLSNLEKVGLVALGALVVGAIINENNKNDRQEVISNTGDRVVVQRPDGSYQIYKDDDAILRRPGSEVRTETYRDGSTRTIVEKDDGTQVVTVRDASGRVLRRATYDDRGRELVLFDDMQPERAVIVSELPRVRSDRVTISSNDADAALKARLAARQIEDIGRSFSLRQIREISQVRDLAATINLDNITFDSGSSAIKATEAEKLADLGGLITDLIKENPAEVFLIEGHTDAVGSGASNLALSDRRAESVALALTEYFDVPPENVVVQGYGEKELRIDTQGDERGNRRVAVRIITPLMTVASR
jgi:outer membrane protein OmpA-like peptidoglycan-associated protein